MTTNDDTKRTPPSGVPAAIASMTRDTIQDGPKLDDHIESDDIRAPKSERTIAILAALKGVQIEVGGMREESRQRGEETAARFDKLDRKVDRLTSDDEALRLDFRRLEQRQAASDEEVRLLREEFRKDRQGRSEDKESLTQTVEAMKKHVEEATRANREAVERATTHAAEAVERFDSATQRFDQAAIQIGGVKEQNDRQDGRLDRLEMQGDAQGRACGAILEELGIEPPQGIEKPTPPSDGTKPVAGKLTKIAEGAALIARKSEGNRKITWAAVAFGGVQVLYILAKILDYVVTKGAPTLP